MSLAVLFGATAVVNLDASAAAQSGVETSTPVQIDGNTDPFKMKGATALNGKITDSFALNAGTFSVINVKGQSDLYAISQNGRFVMRGAIYDLWQGKELSTIAEVKDASTHVAFSQFDAVLPQVSPMVVGHGSRKIVLFVDPYCPWCAKTLQQIPALLKTNKFTFVILPIPMLGERSAEAVKMLGCAEDKTAAVTDLFNHSYDPALPAVAKCDLLPMEKRFVLAKLLNITAIPYLIRDDGVIQVGYPTSLENWLG